MDPFFFGEFCINVVKRGLVLENYTTYAINTYHNELVDFLIGNGL